MDKKLLVLLSLFFLSFVVFITLIFSGQSLFRLTRAKEEFLASGTTSLLLAWPLTVKADGVSQSTISVFIRSRANALVNNKSVSLNTSLGEIKEKEVITDKQGAAVFHLISNMKGIAEVSATVDNTIPVNQKVTIKFE